MTQEDKEDLALILSGAVFGVMFTVGLFLGYTGPTKAQQDAAEREAKASVSALLRASADVIDASVKEK